MHLLVWFNYSFKWTREHLQSDEVYRGIVMDMQALETVEMANCCYLNVLCT